MKVSHQAVVAQLRRVSLALIAAIVSWFLLKLILVPEDPVILKLGSDKPLTGAIHFATVLPWARSAQQILSPEQITPEGGQPREVTIVLEPLGQAHPQGRGSEIWVYEIASELERIGPEDWDSLSLPFPWQHDAAGKAVVFIGDQHTALTVRLKAAAKVTLRLLRHPWSGQARITVDGVSHVVDLYAPESRWGPTREIFILPLPLEVTQRIETALPRTTSNFRLMFVDGPRLMHLKRAEWQSRGLWVWDPKHDTVEVGPGVQILEKSEQGWLFQMEQSEGWIALNHLQTEPFFLPGSWGLIVIFILGFVWWTAWEVYRPRTKVGAFLRGQAYWAKYALPCLVVWLIYWLAFFPGLMSPDSVGQWRQLLQFQFDDWHPASHTLMNWLITRVWLSPAAVALAQIFAMSSLIGWGLAKFGRLGVPSVMLWVVCSLFALSPVMGMMTITLWKDIPHAISMLWLTLLLVEIVVSRGNWLTASRGNLIVLGIVLALISLFRHNGPMVSLGTLLAIGIIYRSFWKYILIAGVVAIGIHGAVRGPLYRALDVKSMPTAFLYSVPVQQVAAVIKAGTPLTPEEQAVLDGIFPLDLWTKRYSCAHIDILYDPNFDQQELDKQVTIFRRIWLNLVLRNPNAVFSHQLCAGSLVWRIPLYYYTVEKGIVPNTLGLSTQSQWPAMRDLLKHLIDWTEHPPIRFVWTPALYLYGLLLVMVVVALRTKRPAWLLYALPALLQSASLLLVNTGQDFRFQFAVYLIAVMSLCVVPLGNVPKVRSPGGEPGVGRFEGLEIERNSISIKGQP